jgi:hypothetical protein
MNLDLVGFGGCMVAFVRAGMVEAFNQSVRLAYYGKVGSKKSALVYQIDRFPVNLNLDRLGIFVSIASSRLAGFPVSAEGLSF